MYEFDFFLGKVEKSDFSSIVTSWILYCVVCKAIFIEVEACHPKLSQRQRTFDLTFDN